jgi:deoxyadenosine/deoxycytidine kinase
MPLLECPSEDDDAGGEHRYIYHEHSAKPPAIPPPSFTTVPTKGSEIQNKLGLLQAILGHNNAARRQDRGSSRIMTCQLIARARPILLGALDHSRTDGRHDTKDSADPLPLDHGGGSEAAAAEVEEAPATTAASEEAAAAEENELSAETPSPLCCTECQSKLLVVIDGSIAKGKTMLLLALKHYGYPVLLEPLDRWRSPLQNYYAEPRHYGYALQDCIIQHYEQQGTSGAQAGFAVERGAGSAAVFVGVMHSQGNLSDDQAQELTSRAVACPTPDLTILLQSSKEVYLQRLQERIARDANPGDTLITDEYMVLLDEAYAVAAGEGTLGPNILPVFTDELTTNEVLQP